MSLVPGTGGDLDSIGEMVVDTDELEENKDAPSILNLLTIKKVKVAMRLQGFAFVKENRRYVRPENDKTVVSIMLLSVPFFQSR